MNSWVSFLQSSILKLAFTAFCMVQETNNLNPPLFNANRPSVVPGQFRKSAKVKQLFSYFKSFNINLSLWQSVKYVTVNQKSGYARIWCRDFLSGGTIPCWHGNDKLSNPHDDKGSGMALFTEIIARKTQNISPSSPSQPALLSSMQNRIRNISIDLPFLSPGQKNEEKGSLSFSFVWF